jgi:FkbM family methyltransferase
MSLKNMLKSWVNGILAPAKLQISRYRSEPALNRDKAMQQAFNGRSHPFVLDIGANQGQTVECILSQYPNVNIVSFEPDPTAFAQLKSLQKNHKFTALNIALGNTNSTLDFYVLENLVSSSLLKPTAIEDVRVPYNEEIAQVIHVPVRRLDDVLTENNLMQTIDLLKLDVQGYEDRVLMGADLALKRTRFILVEANFVSVYQDTCLIDELCYLLYSAGFRLVNAIGFLPALDTLDLLSTDLFFKRIDQLEESVIAPD